MAKTKISELRTRIDELQREPMEMLRAHNADLRRALEIVGGMCSAAPMPSVAPSSAVRLMSFGERKIDVIKAVRTLVPGLGLKEAKDLVESAPVIVKNDMTRYEAEQVARELRAVGATVEVE